MRVWHGTRFRTAFMGIVMVAAVAGSYLAITRVPEPVVDRMIREDTARMAIKWKSTIVDKLQDGAESFRTGRVATSDIEFLNLLVEGTDIYRYKLMSRGGTVFWASRAPDIGTVQETEYFHERVVRGEILTFILKKPPAEVDGFNYQGHVDHGVVDVAEVYIPVAGDGGVLGAIEFYTDISDTRETYVTIIRTALFLICTVGLGTLLVVSGGIARSGNRAVLDMRVRAEKERKLMEEQVRLSREVRLLGELNEWLQSASSLEELFDMVSRFMSHMIPDSAGSVYVYSNSRDVLDGRSTWNGGVMRPHIHPHDCWGLRRGRTYGYTPDELHFTCAHVDEDKGTAPYYCFPVLAHGETVGLMHMTARPGVSAEAFENSRRLAQMCAEQISMAIANVRMRDQLLDQSIRDPLTGLYNRRHMMDHLRRFVESSTRTGKELCVVSIDVDHFKKFNDNHGHDAGDMVLRAVGSVLERACDGDEIACRMGGEEFLLILPETATSTAMVRAEALRKAVEDIRVRYGERTLPRITVSIGLGVFPDHGAIPQDLIRASDDALYEAKAKGRNRVVLALAEDWKADAAQESNAPATAGGPRKQAGSETRKSETQPGAVAAE